MTMAYLDTGDDDVQEWMTAPEYLQYVLATLGNEHLSWGLPGDKNTLATGSK